MRDFLKRMLLPSERTSLDVDLRYAPVLRFLRDAAHPAPLLEVGSGSVGIAPYVPYDILGVDTGFETDLPANLVPVVARGILPFRDRSFPVVITLDTLEHVPPEAREAFVDELVRVADRHLVIGFPTGKAAREHDAALDRYHSDQHGERHPFLREHIDFGVPEEDESQRLIEASAQRYDRAINVRSIKNVNLTLRAAFMRLVWNRRRGVRRLYTGLSLLGRWDRLFSFGRCYRTIRFVSFGNVDTRR